MKITHVIESGGGSADFVLYLTKYLPEHHHTIIYGERAFSRFSEVEQSNSNITFYKWENTHREISIINDLRATFSLYKLFRKIESDVIHVHSSKAGFLGRLVCYFLRINAVIYTPNGLPFIRQDISPAKRKIYLLLERLASKLCGEIISCSKSEANELIRNRINSSYINNGTELITFSNSLQQEKSKNELIIATSGRITIQKNPFLFNEIAKYFENDTRFKFLWIGGGELEPVLNSKNIRITGWVDKPTVSRLLENADIYISTASWEGLPFAILEAMNLRKPLLLSDCIGNIDLVIEGDNGYIYRTSAEAIKKLIYYYETKNDLTRFGNNSYALVEKYFNVTSMANEYGIAYEKSAKKIQ